MVKEELIQRSPLRLFDQSIHGGLKAGEIGVIASQRGIGKTSVLVQLALDKLLQGKKIIHVSFSRQTQYILAWYKDIFDEFINAKDLENADDIMDEVVKNRVLMNFNQDVISKEQIIKSLRALIVEGCFKADTIIIDGFDFYKASYDLINGVKTFAQELEISVWYSCNVKEDNQQYYDKEKIPLVLKDLADIIDVVIVLDPKPDFIEFSISKDRDSQEIKAVTMRLDPETLLISENT